MAKYKYLAREEDRNFLTRNGFKKSDTYLSEVSYVHFFEKQKETENGRSIRIIVEFDEHRSDEVKVSVRYGDDADTFELMSAVFDFQCMTLQDIIREVLGMVSDETQLLHNGICDFYQECE